MIVVVTAAALAAEFDTVAKRTAVAAQLGSLPRDLPGDARRDDLGRAPRGLPVLADDQLPAGHPGDLDGRRDVRAPRRRARARQPRPAGDDAPKPDPNRRSRSSAATSSRWPSRSSCSRSGRSRPIEAFGTLPGDKVGLDAVLAHAAWLYVVAIVPGAIAIRGRAASSVVVVASPSAASTLFASFIVNGYSSTVSALQPLKPLSYFSITAGHRPIAGAWDWPSVAIVAAVALALIVAGGDRVRTPRPARPDRRRASGCRRSRSSWPGRSPARSASGCRRRSSGEPRLGCSG